MTSPGAATPGFRELVFSDYSRHRPHAGSWLRVLALCLTTPGMIACLVLRAQQCLHYSGRRRAAAVLRTLGTVVISADFSAGARVGRGFLLVHPIGVVIGTGAVIGDNVTFAGNVTVASSLTEHREGETPEFPTIGNGCAVGANAVLVGGITLGDGAVVGANSVVLQDVPAGTLVVGAPARVVHSRS